MRVQVTRERVIDWLATPPGLLAAYGAILAVVGLWPVPVDRQLKAWVVAIGKVVPVVTYPPVESLANVALFVPWASCWH